jgi:DNA invertase Pin-like site-specific DNA recombinase
MIVGYARTSTTDQMAGLEAQQHDLEAAGVERVFSEQTSSVGPRKALEEVLEFIRRDDVLTVTKLDRLARSVRDLVQIVDRVERKGASLRILAMGLDTSTSAGRLMLNVFGAVAQFEREIMLERQREGISKAQREGKYKGRKPTAKAKADDVRRLAADGSKREDIAEQLGIGTASVYRILADARKQHVAA